MADIQKNGLREPILLDAEGRIVDGRNRYRAGLAMVAARLAKLMETQAVKRKGKQNVADLPHSHEEGRSRSKAAAIVNISPRLRTPGRTGLSSYGWPPAGSMTRSMR